MCVAQTEQDISQHSHEIGFVNLPFTRKGRRQAAERGKSSGPHVEALPHPSASVTPPASQLSAGPSSEPVGPSSPIRIHPLQQPVPVSFPGPYPHFPSMSMPPPPALATGSGLALHPAHIPPAERERLERERWDRNSIMFQHICNAGRGGFVFNPISLAALETTLVTLTNEVMNPQLQGYLMHVLPPSHGMPPPPPPGHAAPPLANGVVVPPPPPPMQQHSHRSPLQPQSHQHTQQLDAASDDDEMSGQSSEERDGVADAA
jgi:hypothetical protein